MLCIKRCSRPIYLTNEIHDVSNGLNEYPTFLMRTLFKCCQN